MANNLTIKDGTGTSKTVKTTDNASVHTPHHNIDTIAAGSNVIGQVSIDQTTVGTTDSVTVKASAGIGSLTETAPASDTASSGLNGRLQRIAQRLTSLIALLPSALGQTTKSASLSVAIASDNVVTTGGTSLIATGTMTRPADTTAYAAGDGVTTATSSASAMSVTSAARVSAGSGLILGGFAEKSTTSTTNAQFRIWIYQDTPSAVPNDNVAFTAATHADYQKLVCTATFDFASGITGSDGVRVPITLDVPSTTFKLASGTSLTVIWEARAAYTPGNAEVFRLGLSILQD